MVSDKSEVREAKQIKAALFHCPDDSSKFHLDNGVPRFRFTQKSGSCLNEAPVSFFLLKQGKSKTVLLRGIGLKGSFSCRIEG